MAGGMEPCDSQPSDSISTRAVLMDDHSEDPDFEIYDCDSQPLDFCEPCDSQVQIVESQSEMEPPADSQPDGFLDSVKLGEESISSSAFLYGIVRLPKLETLTPLKEPRLRRNIDARPSLLSFQEWQGEERLPCRHEVTFAERYQ